MSSIKIKIKRRDSDWNIVQQTQTVELNKDTAFNLQGDGIPYPHVHGAFCTWPVTRLDRPMA